MSNYVLSCCSTADLSAEHMRRRNISYVSFHFFLDEQEYLDDLWQSAFDDTLFYEKMKNGTDTSTSQVSIGEYCEYFTSFLREGNDILHVCLSSGLSGTYSSAMSGAALALEDFPERKILIVDSLCASTGYGLFMDALADRRDEGMEMEELRDWAEKNKLRLQHWFFSADLHWYVKGGRISPLVGAVGEFFGICPVLQMDGAGRLVLDSKVRTKKKAVSKIGENMLKNAENEENYSGKCYICHSACPADAEAMASWIKKHFPDLNGDVEIYPVGPVIGSHTGPGTVAVFFWGKEREVKNEK